MVFPLRSLSLGVSALKPLFWLYFRKQYAQLDAEMVKKGGFLAGEGVLC